MAHDHSHDGRLVHSLAHVNSSCSTCGPADRSGHMLDRDGILHLKAAADLVEDSSLY